MSEEIAEENASTEPPTYDFWSIEVEGDDRLRSYVGALEVLAEKERRLLAQILTISSIGVTVFIWVSSKADSTFDVIASSTVTSFIAIGWLLFWNAISVLRLNPDFLTGRKEGRVNFLCHLGLDDGIARKTTEEWTKTILPVVSHSQLSTASAEQSMKTGIGGCIAGFLAIMANVVIAPLVMGN